MATKKEKNITTLKTINFEDLLIYKKRKDIMFEDQKLFEVVELEGNKFDEFMKIISENITNAISMENGILKTNMDLDGTIYLLRNMLKGISFGDKTDEEIKDIWENKLGSEIREQVNEAINEFVGSKMLNRMLGALNQADKLNSVFKKVEKDDGKDEATKES